MTEIEKRLLIGLLLVLEVVALSKGYWFGAIIAVAIGLYVVFAPNKEARPR